MKQSLGYEAFCIDKFHIQYRNFSAALFIVVFIILLVSSANSQTSSYSGRYTGDYTSRSAGSGFSWSGNPVHNGTWDISIASDGDITGTMIDQSAGSKVTIKGFIEEDGNVNASLNYETPDKIRGVLEKKGSRLTGKLKWFCNGGDSICATLDLTLKRIDIAKIEPNNSPDKPTYPNNNSSNELTFPEKGLLLIQFRKSNIAVFFSSIREISISGYPENQLKSRELNYGKINLPREGRLTIMFKEKENPIYSSIINLDLSEIETITATLK